MDADRTWDCIVVGGGAAGLSAALVLGRARRATLVVDAGAPSNAPAHGVGGLLGFDGRPPAEVYAAGRADLAAYPSVELRAGEVVDATRDDDGLFTATLSDGTAARTRRILIATGMDYRPPELPGVAERWGRSVFHCPFCHGWEVRGRRLGVLDRGAGAVHRAVLLTSWSDDVTVYTGGAADFTAEESAQMRGAGVTVDNRPVVGLAGPGDTLTAVVLEGGVESPCEGLLVATTMHQRSDLAARLGATAAEPNPIMADPLVVDTMLATTAPGVFAAGDLTGEMPSVPSVIASGMRAGAMVVNSLMQERARAVAA